jgi:hypothetical protein
MIDGCSFFYLSSLLVGRSIRHCNVEQAINYNWGRYAAQGAGSGNIRTIRIDFIVVCSRWFM